MEWFNQSVSRVKENLTSLSFTRKQKIVTAICTTVLGAIILRNLLRRKMKLKGKTCLIIGASSGIGEGLAREFVKQGCKVILTARRVEKLNDLKQSLVETYNVSQSDVQVFYMDVSKQHELQEIMDDLLKEHTIDILVNSAGIIAMDTIDRTELHMFQRIMDVNFYGSVITTKAVLPMFRERKSGSFIFIGSLAGKVSSPLISTYAASKSAMQSFADSLRAENSDVGLDVLLVSPGLVATDIFTGMLKGDGSQYSEPVVSNDDVKKGLTTDQCAQWVVSSFRNYENDIIVVKENWMMNTFVALRNIWPDFLFWGLKFAARSMKKTVYKDAA